MSRFEFRGDYAMRIVNNGNLLAYFNVVDTEIGIEFRNNRLIKGSSGVFVSPPADSYENADGETKYSNHWSVAYDFDSEEWDEIGDAWRQEMLEAALEHYNALVGDEDDDEDSYDDEDDGIPVPTPRKTTRKGNARSKTTAKRSGRGPVPTVNGNKRKKFPF